MEERNAVRNSIVPGCKMSRYEDGDRLMRDFTRK